MKAPVFSGQTAIVTGGASGLGLAITRRLQAEGAFVIVFDLDIARSAGLAQEFGARGRCAAVDVTSEAAVRSAVDAIFSERGRIDILVNNAALRREKAFADMSYADWRELMDVTLDGAFHCVKACLPALRKNGGAIVNIGGMSAHIGSKHRAHVMTAKAALVGFTRGLAHDLAADRISVNCAVPGAIDTSRAAAAPSPARHLTHGTITGERGTSEDVAALVHFLCTPAAHFITGQAIHANGGAYLGS